MSENDNSLAVFNTLNNGVDWLGDKLSNGFDWFSNTWDKISTPKGTGDNAKSSLELGGQLLTGLYGIYNQNKNFKDQLNEARRQFAFSKGNTQANFMNQGTNFINQGLWQLEALNAFNPNAAAERAQNFGAAVDQMNQAASRLELGNNAFGAQQNALQKYNQIKSPEPRLA